MAHKKHVCAKVVKLIMGNEDFPGLARVKGFKVHQRTGLILISFNCSRTIEGLP